MPEKNNRMSIDRQIPPIFKTVDSLNLLPVEVYELDNGIKVHIIEAGSQEVAKIDVIFPAGSVQAGKPLVASATNTVMAEGTTTLTSVEISEKIDFYGAYIGQQTDYHHSILTLISLSHYLPETLAILEDIIKNPVFPQHEIDNFLSKRKQNFLVEGEKVKTIAMRAFTQHLFSKEHPYGNYLSEEHFEQLTREDLVNFHKHVYTPEHTHILIAGQPGADIKKLLNKHLGQKWGEANTPSDIVSNFDTIKPETIVIPKSGAVQSAIKIGCRLFNKEHPDYFDFQILNTILGGYFGSRLMTNIREEKGLTYGISSFIMPYKNSGFMVIATEVKAENRELAVLEIFNEMQRLRDELISDDELNLVKSYMSGDMIRNFDGPFATADNYCGLIDLNLSPDHFQKRFNAILNMTPERLLKLANKYLQPNDFTTVIAGQ